MGAILLIISIILTSVFTVISIPFVVIEYIIKLKWKSGIKQSDKFLKGLATSIDQFGNISSSRILNLTLLKKRTNGITEGKDKKPIINFGDMDMTISYVIGVNKYQNNLSLTGKLIERILNLLEKNHVEIAIENQFLNDKSASVRMFKKRHYYPTVD
jgi:hypothetical protein